MLCIYLKIQEYCHWLMGNSNILSTKAKQRRRGRKEKKSNNKLTQSLSKVIGAMSLTFRMYVISPSYSFVQYTTFTLNVDFISFFFHFGFFLFGFFVCLFFYYVFFSLLRVYSFPPVLFGIFFLFIHIICYSIAFMLLNISLF